MDEATIRRHAEQHAKANEAGDFDTAMKDLSDEGRTNLREVGRALPRPIETAEVLEVTGGGDRWTTKISYRGGDTETIVESDWEEREGRPMIVELRLT
ncbi:MAG: hypothetical protein ACRDI1_06545 [Actinomycetota bacterium]|jgi:hypothetical protein